MSNNKITISELETTTLVGDDDYIAVDDGETTKKVSVAHFNSSSNITAEYYANKAAEDAATVAANIATSAAQIREAKLAARDAEDAKTAAQGYKADAQGYASTAQNYAGNAALSATAAAESEDAASRIATSSSDSATLSQSYAIGGTGTRSGEDIDNAMYYHLQASQSATVATNAKADAETAKIAAESAQEKAEAAQEVAKEISEDMAEAAEGKIQEAEEKVQESEAWAKGTKDGTPVESTDPQYDNHSKHWSEVAALYASQVGSAVKWRGAILFENIPTTGMRNGDYYEITEGFTADARFNADLGIYYPSGTGIVWNEEETLWDIKAKSDSGHTIRGEDNVDLPQQPILQFEQSKAKNEGASGKTIITPDIITISDVEIEEGDPIPKTFYAYMSKLPYYPPTWADGTDQEIVEALQKHYLGEVDLRDYWNVGDERTVPLAAMAADGVSESHIAQDVKFVIASVDSGVDAISNPCYNYQLVTPIGNITRPVFILAQKDCLEEPGKLHGGTDKPPSWDVTTRRTWCNEIYREAIPSTIRGIFKQVQVKSGETGASETLITSSDYFFFPSPKEVFGGTTPGLADGNPTEFDALSQFEYYQTAMNRIKELKYPDTSYDAGYYWWERSHVELASVRDFCCIRIDEGLASKSGTSPTRKMGLAPHGCI